MATVVVRWMAGRTRSDCVVVVMMMMTLVVLRSVEQVRHELPPTLQIVVFFRAKAICRPCCATAAAALLRFLKLIS
jgi:hypothetical protein